MCIQRIVNISLLIVACEFSAHGSPAFAEGPAEWASFRNGPQNQGIANSPLPDNLELLWEMTTPDGVTTTPVISGEHAFVGTLSGDLHCIELKTGTIVWTYQTLEKKDPNEFAPGFSSPLALSKTLVFGGDDFGTFHAVDRTTGQQRWTVSTDAEIIGGAQVLGDSVIFGSHDGYLYCRHIETGEQVWSVETLGPVNATPSLAGKYTFTTGCDQPILRVIDLEAGIQAKEIPLEALLIASSAMRDDILYFGSDGGTVYALDWGNGEVKWTYSNPDRQQEIRSSPAVTEDVVIIGSRDKHLYCLNRSNGDLQWSVATRGRIDASPVVAGDRVYFGSADKNLYAVRIADGTEVWKYPAKQPFTGSPAIANGYLVVGTDATDGKILCFGKKQPLPE